MTAHQDGDPGGEEDGEDQQQVDHKRDGDEESEDYPEDDHLYRLLLDYSSTFSSPLTRRGAIPQG